MQCNNQKVGDNSILLYQTDSERRGGSAAHQATELIEHTQAEHAGRQAVGAGSVHGVVWWLLVPAGGSF
jgi:hypothetical protein